MDALVQHAKVTPVSFATGAADARMWSKWGVRGHPDADPALMALVHAWRQSRWPLHGALGEVLDLSGAPALLSAFLAARGQSAQVTLALSSAATIAAAEATLARERVVTTHLRAALPWELQGLFDVIVWRPPADRGRARLALELAAVAARLAAHGTAVLVAHRDEGAQRMERDALAFFHEVNPIAREAGWRITLLRAPQAAPLPEMYVPLGDGLQVLPGVFAGDRVDAGTALLLQVRHASGEALAGQRVCDLGCGSGVLAHAALKAGAKQVLALDEDLAAVRSTQRNLGNHASVRVLHADLIDVCRVGDHDGSAGSLDDVDAAMLGWVPVDEVWCNPPFHVGRQVVGSLTAAFAAAAHALLRQGGVAWFVVNRAVGWREALAGWTRAEERTPAGEETYSVIRAER